INEIEMRDNMFPSVSVYIDLKETMLGKDGYIMPSIQLEVSKIIPVYRLIAGYTVKHEDIEAEIDLWGPPQTVDLMETVDHVHAIIKSNGNIELHERYDLDDKIYDWDQIPYSKPFGRTFTLREAVFNDILGLCDN